jgi:hypothetical protein
VPFALFSQFYNSCSPTLASFSSFLSFSLKDTFSSFPKKRCLKTKKAVVDTKLTEEEKLFEQKKAMNAYIAGFLESMAKSNTEKITKEILEGLSEDTGDSDNYDAESGEKILRIDCGGQVIQFLGNRQLSRAILTI